MRVIPEAITPDGYSLTWCHTHRRALSACSISDAKDREVARLRALLLEVAEDAKMAARDPHFHWDRLAGIPAKARRVLSEADP